MDDRIKAAACQFFLTGYTLTAIGLVLRCFKFRTVPRILFGTSTGLLTGASITCLSLVTQGRSDYERKDDVFGSIVSILGASISYALFKRF